MVNGVFIIDKPAGITSHDAVWAIRKVTHEGRVGHAGTLDPFATGVLVIGAGSATRFLEYTHALSKTYEAVFILGATSDTDDVTGVISPTAPTAQPSTTQIEDALRSFLGTIQQVPPTYAAIKIQGRKLYEEARAGRPILANPRAVTIHTILLRKYDYPEVTVEITCGTGTYIRAIGRDLGQLLKTGAYTKHLRRTAIGTFSEQLATPLSDLSPANFSNYLHPVETLVHHLPRVTLTESQYIDFTHGKMITGISISESGPHAIFTQDTFVGIGTKHSEGILKAQKVLLIK